MNVKQGGSRQSLSGADQKLLRMKDPEHLYISSQGRLQVLSSPPPLHNLGHVSPLSGPWDLTQSSLRQSWRSTRSVLKEWIQAVLGETCWALREADFLGSLEKEFSP